MLAVAVCLFGVTSGPDYCRSKMPRVGRCWRRSVLSAHPRGGSEMPWFARAFLAVAVLGASLAPLVASAEG